MSLTPLTHARAPRFSLADLFAFFTAILILIGVVAAIDTWVPVYEVVFFGIGWYGEVRSYLIYKVGLPMDFVCGYVAFAMLHASSWICYLAIAAVLGLLRWRWAKPLAIAFVTSILVWDFANDSFSGLQAVVNLRVVSLTGAVITALAFVVARRLRGGAASPPGNASRTRIIVASVAVAMLIAFSAFGWWTVDLNRQAGLEAQKMFDQYR